MTREVFVLDKYEKRILRCIAVNGPQNLNQISKFTLKYVDSLDRWAVKNRLYGSSRILGLIPNEYVIEIDENKRRFGKEEKSFHLSAKGILASTAVVPIEQNKFFIFYIEQIGKFLKSKKMQSFAEKYIIEHMKLLVAWHYINGIQLTKIKSLPLYYSNFIKQIKTSSPIDITIGDKQDRDEFVTITTNCDKYSTVLEILDENILHEFANSLSMRELLRNLPSNVKTYFPYLTLISNWNRIKYYHAHIGSKIYLEHMVPEASKNELDSRDRYRRVLKKDVEKILREIVDDGKWKSVLDKSE